jgi:hypothetical protein
MTPIYDYTIDLAKPFLYKDTANSEDVIVIGEKLTEDYFKKYQKTQPHLTLGEVEHIFLADEFFVRILKYKSIMIHSSAVKYKGKCYLFSAPSGIGKSTHTKMWKKIYGDDVEIINDDKPVVRLIDNNLYAYGTPFAGGTYGYKDDRGLLDTIVFLKRGENNSIKEITNAQALPQLLYETTRKLHKVNMEKVFDMFDLIFEKVKFYELFCNMEEDAAILAHDTIVKEENNEG